MYPAKLLIFFTVMYCVFYFVFCLRVSRYSLGVSQEEMKQELRDYLPSLEYWAKDYLNSPTQKAISLKMYVHAVVLINVMHSLTPYPDQMPPLPWYKILKLH